MPPSRMFLDPKATQPHKTTNIASTSRRGQKKSHHTTFQDYAYAGSTFVSSIPDGSGSGLNKTKRTIIKDIKPLKRTFLEDDDDEQEYFPEDEPLQKKATSASNKEVPKTFH